VLAAFGIAPEDSPALKSWNDINERVRNPKARSPSAIVGKYTGMKDAYKSLIRGAVAWRHRQQGEGQPRLDRKRSVRA